MALIVVRDIKMKCDRIINTAYIFHCFEYDGAVRINYSEGDGGRNGCTVSGTLAEFAESIGAERVGV